MLPPSFLRLREPLLPVPCLPSSIAVVPFLVTPKSFLLWVFRESHEFWLLNINPGNFLWCKKKSVYFVCLHSDLQMLLLSNNKRVNSSPSLYNPIPHNLHHRERYTSTCLSVQRFTQRWLVTLRWFLMLVIAVRRQTVGLLCVFLLQWEEAAERQYTSQGNIEGHKIMSPTRHWTEKHEEMRVVECGGECVMETDSEKLTVE